MYAVCTSRRTAGASSRAAGTAQQRSGRLPLPLSCCMTYRMARLGCGTSSPWLGQGTRSWLRRLARMASCGCGKAQPSSTSTRDTPAQSARSVRWCPPMNNQKAFSSPPRPTTAPFASGPSTGPQPESCAATTATSSTPSPRSTSRVAVDSSAVARMASSVSGRKPTAACCRKSWCRRCRCGASPRWRMGTWRRAAATTGFGCSRGMRRGWRMNRWSGCMRRGWRSASPRARQQHRCRWRPRRSWRSRARRRGM